ncbi:MAG TPA: helix-turn-helix domain-containing protein [Gaiellaceae bacterium]|nr:helix-turn-helix domain-containing protein [Gaiellaceae bacterium]
MTRENKTGRRAYRAPQREAAASRTRETIVRTSRELFEARGWAATTMRSVADQAGVSLKTVEALFGTKATLLRAAVDYAIRGDVDPLPMPQRETVARIERAATATAMLDLHAEHLRRINERSARIAWVVEQAAAGDPVVEALWSELNRNRTYAVNWATTQLLSKPGRRAGLRRRDVEAAFWVALDWGTYRTLTQHAGLTADDYQAWLRRYYRLAFLPR